MDEPLNNGTALHTVTGPKLAYCPNASSMYTTGIPTNTSIIMYGIKNAPATEKIK